MNKRLLIIVLIFILLLAGVAGVFYYSAQKQEVVVEESTAPLQIRKVLDEEVISPIGAHDNNSIWYFNSEGRLFSINIDGSNLSEFPLPALPGRYLQRALWPKDGGDFIMLSGDDMVLINYYSNATKTYINLPANIQYLEWLPDGKRVVYIWKADDGKSQQLVMADADGSGYKTIADVFWPDLVLKSSSDGKTALMYRSNITDDTNKIYSANLETGEITTLIDQGKNLSAMWLPTGDKFLYATDQKVYLYDVSSKTSTDLNLSITLDKIVSDSAGKYLYANTNGSFAKIDLATNKSENYFTPSTSVEVKSMILVGSTVYYIDATDRKLYRISK